LTNGPVCPTVRHGCGSDFQPGDNLLRFFPLMIRAMLIAVFVVLLVVGALAAVKTLQIRTLITGRKSFVLPPETVLRCFRESAKKESLKVLMN
jgi:hypothetical protein